MRYEWISSLNGNRQRPQEVLALTLKASEDALVWGQDYRQFVWECQEKMAGNKGLFHERVWLFASVERLFRPLGFIRRLRLPLEMEFVAP